MYRDKSIAVVVPCFNEEKQINTVIDTMPPFVDAIICVDDASTDSTREVLINSKNVNNRVALVLFEKNGGVGAAIDAGYGEALRLGHDLIAVMAGDGQMDPGELQFLIDALITTQSDYSKITRLYEPSFYEMIPKIRLIGNSILSILTRLSSGYWNMSDSQTGYTVIDKDTLARIQGSLWTYYGFPNDVLNKLGLLGKKIVEIPSKPVYGVGEVSTLKPMKVALPILRLLVRGFFTRIKVQYFFRSFHPVGIGYLLSIIGLFLSGMWLTKIFIFDFIVNHDTHPIQVMSSFFFLQSSIVILWFTLIFDALLNKDNCILIHIIK